MPYGVGAFMLFGLGSLPAGRLGDLWGRRQMMLVFFFGMGASALLVALTQQRLAARGRAHADGRVLVDLPPGRHPDAGSRHGAAGPRDRRQRARRQSRRRAGGGDHGSAGQVRRLARGLRGPGAAVDRDAASLFARVAPLELAPPAQGVRTRIRARCAAARPHLRRHDDGRDRVEPAVQPHDQRQRPALARAALGHRRRSRAARARSSRASTSSHRSRRSRSACSSTAIR